MKVGQLTVGEGVLHSLSLCLSLSPTQEQVDSIGNLPQFEAELDGATMSGSSGAGQTLLEPRTIAKQIKKKELIGKSDGEAWNFEKRHTATCVWWCAYMLYACTHTHTQAQVAMVKCGSGSGMGRTWPSRSSPHWTRTVGRGNSSFTRPTCSTMRTLPSSSQWMKRQLVSCSSWVMLLTQLVGLVNENIVVCSHPSPPHPLTVWRVELWLVMEYHPNGSLYDYLQVRTLSATELYRLLLSVANGLQYLHLDVTAGQMEKPGIAHRDLKSRNILVKLDGSCCIADFGLAVRHNLSTGKVDQLPSNTRQGTKRYMAPEILDGTINAMMFESYRMVDIYCFGLVMWEVARRIEVNGKEGELVEWVWPQHDASWFLIKGRSWWSGCGLGTGRCPLVKGRSWWSGHDLGTADSTSEGEGLVEWVWSQQF